MKTAAQIMKKNAVIKGEIKKQTSKDRADVIWSRATEKLASILEQYAELPHGVRMHTDKYIFPAAAIYLTAKEALEDSAAYRIIEDVASRYSSAAGRKLAALMRVPGMRSLFIKAWDPMARRMFGVKNGFRNVFYPKKKGEYRMDITACPYCRYFKELGSPELTRIFCENDERVYGNLPGIAFERTGTLGTGADRCDFCVKKV